MDVTFAVLHRFGCADEVFTPCQVAPGMALSESDDGQRFAAEVEAGERLAVDRFAVEIAPVDLFPGWKIRRQVWFEPAPKIGKVDDRLRFYNSVPSLYAMFCQRGERLRETSAVVAGAQLLVPVLVAKDQRYFPSDVESGFAVRSFTGEPAAAGSSGQADQKTPRLPFFREYLPQLAAPSFVFFVKS